MNGVHPVRSASFASGHLNRELAVAVAALVDATGVAADVRDRIGHEAFLKPDRSPVTIADFAVQAIVASRLRDEFPADPVVAEEDSALLRGVDGERMLARMLPFVRRAMPDADADGVLNAIDCGNRIPGERFWTLDPIDGTEGFVRDGQYAIALALVVDGRVEIGVLGCPRLSFDTGGDEITHGRSAPAAMLAFAMRGHGAFAAPSTAVDDCIPLHVSQVRDGVLRVLRSRAGHHIDEAAFDRVVRELGRPFITTPMDGQAKHVVLAAGRADVLLRIPASRDYRDKIWDHAAGTLIVEEAGGRVTDLRGNRLDFRARTLDRNYGVVASNGWVHDAVIGAIGRLGL